MAPGRIYGRDGRVRRFSMMAGIGFDAHVVARVDPAIKCATGNVLASLVQLVQHGDRLYDLVIDGRRYRAASAIVAKGHFYGGRFVVAPNARLGEPYLHGCLFRRTGRWNGGGPQLTGRLPLYQASYDTARIGSAEVRWLPGTGSGPARTKKDDAPFRLRASLI